MYTFFISVSLIIFLFFLSRMSINTISEVLFKVFKKDFFVYSIIAIIFFPGTVIHELSHFLMAIILLLKVRELHLLPRWQKNTIKLGYVVYEKKDPLRGILVGIAPFISGITILWLLFFYKFFPSTDIRVIIFFIYFIFVLSTTMFSSKQDMVDLIFVVPFILISGLVVFIFQINISQLIPDQIFNQLAYFFSNLNGYLVTSLIVHICLIATIKFILYISRR